VTLDRLTAMPVRYPLVATVGLATVMWVLAPEYAAAQGSTTAAELRSIVGGDVDAYRWAAIVDIPFALAYTLLALSVAGRAPTSAQRLRQVALVGAAMVATAAAIDVVENVLLIDNLSSLATVDDDAVALVAGFGPPKWVTGLTGGVIALAGSLLGKRS
jgi:hypothetical protein